MSNVIKGISAKKMPDTGNARTPGTVYAMQIVNTGILHKQTKNTAPITDGISTLLNNLSSLQQSHLDGRESYFKQNLPFYTCLNALENIWQKEMPDGSITQVLLTFDWANDKSVEKLLKTIS